MWLKLKPLFPGRCCFAKSGAELVSAYPRLKRWLNVIGGLLGLVGVLFVFQRLFSHTEKIDLSHFNLSIWIIIFLLSLSYCFANVFLARAWWNLLGFFEVVTEWRWAFKVYGLSQMAKYIPGNIFHLAGRQALGMAAGLAVQPIAKSIIGELIFISVAGGFFGFLVVPQVFFKLSSMSSSILFLLISIVFLVTINRKVSPSAAVTLLWQMVFLAISGLVFVGTLTIVISDIPSPSSVVFLCGAYVIAWLAGLLTPGAPAGVGVREMVLLFLLGGQFSEAYLLMAIVLARAITVVGDFIYFMIATFSGATN